MVLFWYRRKKIYQETLNNWKDPIELMCVTHTMKAKIPNPEQFIEGMDKFFLLF